MPDQIEGSQAVARTVGRCRPEVVAAYPISPQTHIVEGLSDLVRMGGLTGCEYLIASRRSTAVAPRTELRGFRARVRAAS